MVAGVSMGGFSGRPVSPGLFGGYPSRPVASAFIRNHNLDRLAAERRTPHDIWEAVEVIEGDWEHRHQNSGMVWLTDGDLCMTCAPSGPGYGDVLERDPQLVMEDLRSHTISHRTARDVYKVVYREDNLVVDVDETASARREARAARIAAGKPFDKWLEKWSERRPPDHVMTMYGEWPNGLETPLVGWEPAEELLDEHVRELGAPRAETARY